MPHELQKRHHHPILEHDAVDYRHVSEVDCEPEEEHGREAELLRWLLAYALKGLTAQTIGSRVLTLSHVLGFQDPRTGSLADIAKEAGVSREAVRQQAKELEVLANLRPQQCKTDDQRATMSKARREYLSAQDSI